MCRASCNWHTIQHNDVQKPSKPSRKTLKWYMDFVWDNANPFRTRKENYLEPRVPKKQQPPSRAGLKLSLPYIQAPTTSRHQDNAGYCDDISPCEQFCVDLNQKCRECQVLKNTRNEELCASNTFLFININWNQLQKKEEKQCNTMPFTVEP